MGWIPWESLFLEDFNISPIAVLTLEYEEGAARNTQYEHLSLNTAELLRVLSLQPTGWPYPYPPEEPHTLVVHCSWRRYCHYTSAWFDFVFCLCGFLHGMKALQDQISKDLSQIWLSLHGLSEQMPMLPRSVLCHGRDVHLMWVKLFTKTLRERFLSSEYKSEEDLESFWWEW